MSLVEIATFVISINGLTIRNTSTDLCYLGSLVIHHTYSVCIWIARDSTQKQTRVTTRY